MNIDIHTKKNWFSARWEKEISAKGEISSAGISTLTDAILRQIAPREIFHVPSILSLKGRDPSQEILFLSGRSKDSNEELTYQIHSAFHSFEGPHIRHSLSRKSSFAFPPFLRPEALGYIAPLTITHFRFAIERYENLFKPLSLGYTPEVTERLLIDYEEGKMEFLMMGEMLKDKHSIPFSKTGEGNRLVELVGSL